MKEFWRVVKFTLFSISAGVIQMASFALLPIFSGFSFDLPHHRIGFSPVITGDFRCMWNLGTGWVEYFRTESEHKITVAAGSLELTSISLSGIGAVKKIVSDGMSIFFTQDGDRLLFDATTIKNSLRVLL